jgi:MSHA biogenesis protein MshJ
MSGRNGGTKLGGLISTAYEKYNGFSLRERMLVTLSVLSVTWMVWSATVGGFIEDSKVQIERDIDVVYAQMQAEVAQQSLLESAKANDPNTRLGKERTILDAELKLLGSSLGSVLDRFVAPERMPALLEDVIRNHKGLKLTRMVSLPVESINVGEPEPVEGDEKPKEVPKVYKHPLRLEFEGSYFEVVAYLAELERSDWEFGWRRLDYVVTEHPIAEVTIEIETLSRDRSWIGV